MILQVKEKRFEGNNCFSLILEKPAGFNFYAGQYLDVKLPVKDKLGNSRTFTISSSPTEDFLMITTKKGISQFKKAMEKLQTGDPISTTHPIGTFTLDESQAAVFITGGIGITPFRSIIKYALDCKLTTPITLLYSNSDDNFLFKEELDKWQNRLPNLTIHYIMTSQVGRLDKEGLLKLYPKVDSLNTIYYLAGPPGMVDDLAKMLINSGIDQTNIRYDRFDGY